MAQVKNVNLEVLNNRVRVTGRLEFNPNEVGRNYAIKILLFGDDTGENNFPTLAPLYTFKFGEPESQQPGIGLQFSSLSKSVIAAPVVNIDETDRLDLRKLNEDPGTHLDNSGGTISIVGDQDEVYAVIRLFRSTNLQAAIATGKSETVVGTFV